MDNDGSIYSMQLRFDSIDLVHSRVPDLFWSYFERGVGVFIVYSWESESESEKERWIGGNMTQQIWRFVREFKRAISLETTTPRL